MVDASVVIPAFMRDRFSDDPGRKKEVHYIYRMDRVGDWRYFFSDDPGDSSIQLFPGQMIRCGNCEGCRVDKSRDWANRMLLEKEYWPDDQCYFVTLTYDEDHVPKSYYGDPVSGEAQPVLTLSPEDLQLFLKRLRKRVEPDTIKYFACGEYGPETFRPHYHLIIFGLRLNDLVTYGRGEAGFMYYQSNFLTSVWAERKAPTRHGSVTPLSADPDYFCTPLGRVLVAPATWQTFAYVARYTTKKLYGSEAQFYQHFNIVPPFLRMSTKPAIGKRWFDDHPDVYDFEYISVETPTGGRKFRPPRYFDRLFDAEDPEAYVAFSAHRREMTEAAQRAKLSNTSLLYSELLEVEEREFRSRIKALKRSL